MDNNNLRQPNATKMALIQAHAAGIPDSHEIITSLGDEDVDVDDESYIPENTFDFETNGEVAFMFIPEEDSTFTEIEEAGTPVAEKRLAWTYGAGIAVPGRFTRLVVDEGKVHIYKIKM
jgi:hypothetical protein